MSNYEIGQRDKPFSSLSIGDWLAFNTRGDACQKISSDQIGFTVGNRFEVETIERIHDGVYPVYFYAPITEHDEEQTLMNQELSQGFTCEIDDRDDMECGLCDDGNGAKELVLIFTSRREIKGGITIGRGQIQKLIDFLEQIKQRVRE